MRNAPSMTIEELIAELQDIQKTVGEHAQVFFAYDYGDHWRTEVAGTIQSVERGAIEFSDYHRMHKTQKDENGDDIDDGIAVILRSH